MKPEERARQKIDKIELDTTFEMTPDQVLDLFLAYIRRNTEIQQEEMSELFMDCLKEIAKTPRNPSITEDKK